MRYCMRDGIVVRSENAAKPVFQASNYLKNIILKLPIVDNCFDYGCGKLRYVNDILHTADSVSVVDSEIQLSRKQIILKNNTSIREMYSNKNNINVQNIAEFENSTVLYDRGFCLNVLSAIPFQGSRRRVLRIISSKLRPSGTCLFVVQYRNSDFTRMAKMENAIRWRDGILIKFRRGYSFYGLIPPNDFEELISSGGMNIVKTSLHEGSVFVTAQKV